MTDKYRVELFTNGERKRIVVDADDHNHAVQLARTSLAIEGGGSIVGLLGAADAASYVETGKW